MITIQKATPEDVEGNSDVFYIGWLNTYPNEEYGITKKDIEDKFKYGKSPEALENKRQQIINMPPNELFLNAKDGDKIVGVCRLMKKEGGQELGAIYVLPEYQHKGIGTMFWNEALKFFDKDKDIIVKLAVYNNNAMEFYKHLGFKNTGVFIKDAHKFESGSSIPEEEMVYSHNK